MVEVWITIILYTLCFYCVKKIKSNNNQKILLQCNILLINFYKI